MKNCISLFSNHSFDITSTLAICLCYLTGITSRLRESAFHYCDNVENNDASGRLNLDLVSWCFIDHINLFLCLVLVTLFTPILKRPSIPLNHLKEVALHMSSTIICLTTTILSGVEDVNWCSSLW